MSQEPKHTRSDRDPDQYFRTDHLKADLKAKSVRGGFVTVVGQFCKFALRTVSTIVLARLLEPQDYGLFGMVTVVFNFVALFKDLGLSLATIQQEKINHAQVSTLFWINFASSASLMLLIWLLAPGIAWFYNDTRVIGMTQVLSIGFIFGGLTAQHEALLKRQMRFGNLAKIEIASMFFSIPIAVVCAWLGFSYWALIVQQVVGQFANVVGVWILCGWRPGLPVKNSGVRSMLVVGGNFTGFNIVNYFSRNLDNIIIGKYGTAEELGLYSKAYQLLLLPVQQSSLPIRSVAIPVLSSLRSDPDKYRNYYLKAMLLMVTLGMPVVVFCFVTADNLIPTLLGSQWSEAAKLFQVLAVAAFLGTFGMAPGLIFISLGRTDRQLMAAIVSSIITVISFLIGIQWGSIGVACGYSISRAIVQPATIIYACRDSPIQLRDLALVLYKPALASVSAAFVLAAINRFLFVGFNAALYLLLDAILYSILYLAIWLILPQGKKTMLEMVQLVKSPKQTSKK